MTKNHRSPAFKASNRTERKAQRLNLQVQTAIQQQELEQEQERVVQEYQATLHDRIAELEAQNASLSKSSKKNAKKTARKRARRATLETGDRQVVHASGSCEMSDADILDQTELLEEVESGMSPAIDDQLEAHNFAQRALRFIQDVEVNSASTLTPRSASSLVSSSEQNNEGTQESQGAPNQSPPSLFGAQTEPTNIRAIYRTGETSTE
jgi:hypothetical protein